MDDNERVLRRLKLSDLRLLRAVVEWGGMAKAARQLNMSQPAVSKTIAAMEHAFGVRLLDRGRRGVQATLYGEALLSGGVTVFDELTQCLNRMRFLSDPSAGLVRIGCTEAGAASFVPTVIAKFAQERPRVSTPTLFSAKFNGRNVDNQRKADCWVEALRSRTTGGSMGPIEYGRATT